MLTISPVGLNGTALTANQLSILVNIKEKLCRPYCINSTTQPQVAVSYSYDNPVLNKTTVFVPITAIITVVTPGDQRCNATTQLFTEKFTVAFQGQTQLPTSVTIESVGQIHGGSNVNCCRASSYSYNDSITVTIA
jgi:hypothetical protein